MIDTEIFFVT